MSIRIALFEPRIPQNTGNIARTCAAFNIELNLIGPLGFSLDDKYLKRAGLDYWPYVNIKTFDDFISFSNTINKNNNLVSCSKSGGCFLQDFKFSKNDIYLFGREDTGLPTYIKNNSSSILTIPMAGISDSRGKSGVRSLNLSVSCGIVAFYSLSKLGI